MPFNFDFSTGQILWTLTFAALLVLLVVLLGRDRVRRFPWFTISMALTALRMLASRLLFHRMPTIVLEEILLVLAVLAAIVSLLLVVEVARRAFAGASSKEWIPAAAALLAVGAAVLVFWGPWPAFKTLFAASQLAFWRLMELFAQKADLLGAVLVILVGLLVVVFGRYYKAGWFSHTQQIAIGLAMAAIAQLTIRSTLQHMAKTTVIHGQDDYQRFMHTMQSLNNANSVIFLVVLIWWIACLWIDEPGTENRGQEQGLGTRD
jgi:hypothetical protein